MKEFSVNKSGHPVYYYYNNKSFFIDSPLFIDAHFEETMRNIEKIKTYCSTSERFLEIKSVKRNRDRLLIETELLKDYYPLIIMKSNYGIYDLNEKKIIQRNFKQLLSMSLVDLQELYDEIVKEYQSFINKTGFYYFDMSSNNIMINKDDVKKFKIIDVLSIKKANFKTIEVNPLSVLLYHNIVKHNCLTEKTIKNKCSVFYSFAKDVLKLEEIILKLKKLKSITLKGDK